MITAHELAAKVDEMLNEQQKYFKTKDILQLQKCKRVEKEVRTMVQTIKSFQHPQTLNLFDNETHR
ncbi:hypothetical protein [Williamwhitmania taraxaci]|uniref:Uncharacterized protein n=1 Tax=Williamwhitmania taraxaci TaxID=1640674 RepID=A0A1G6MDE4_9BACT|nr:hypothetical protein [Williamwhitmania taraxaci]SDC53592.1 hypothetical protein SAMN05216323_103548 [Williamwhitmania taraxaci]